MARGAVRWRFGGLCGGDAGPMSRWWRPLAALGVGSGVLRVWCPRSWTCCPSSISPLKNNENNILWVSLEFFFF